VIFLEIALHDATQTSERWSEKIMMGTSKTTKKKKPAKRAKAAHAKTPAKRKTPARKRKAAAK